MRFTFGRATLGIATFALAGCAGSSTTTPQGATQNQSIHQVQRHAGTVLVSESFANTSSAPGWLHSKGACLTAGTKPKAPGSLAPCGKNAPLDPPGSGALQLTAPVNNDVNFVAWHKALPTANGLNIQYNLYSFDGTSPGADGSLVFFTYGSDKPPKMAAGTGGYLGYLSGGGTGLNYAYLGVGFDEYGNFSNSLTNGPGFVPETVALGGSYLQQYQYLGGVTNGSGVPASLPFMLDDPSSPTRPANAPTIDISLTPAGLVEVAIDIHDGNGPVTYLSENIVGIAGQPAVPPSVFVGFMGATGGLDNRHQIGSLTISTLQ